MIFSIYLWKSNVSLNDTTLLFLLFVLSLRCGPTGKTTPLVDLGEGSIIIILYSFWNNLLFWFVLDLFLKNIFYAIYYNSTICRKQYFKKVFISIIQTLFVIFLYSGGSSTWKVKLRLNLSHGFFLSHVGVSKYISMKNWWISNAKQYSINRNILCA